VVNEERLAAATGRRFNRTDKENHMNLRMGAVLAVVTMLCAAVRADIADLLPRIPADANAVVAVDAAAVLASPIAQAQGWGKKEDPPLFLQPHTDKVVVAAKIDLGTMDSNWEVGVLQMSKAPSMSGIALAESGAADTLADLPAVWSARHAYFIALDKQILGVTGSDDRQFAARWAKQQAGATRPVISTYLQEAAREVKGKTSIVMALDLQDALSLNKVRRALASDLARATLLKDVKVDAVAQLLSTLKGLMVKFQFSNEVAGQIVLTFGADPTIIQPVAQPLLKGVLTQNGIGLSDLDNWDVTVEGTKLVYTGKLSVDSFLKVMSLVQPPAPTSTDEAAKPAAPGASPSEVDKQAAVIAASQRYFKAVSATLDSFSQPTSAGAGAQWLKRASARIDKLPMVNVDPDLLQWGAQVSAAMLQGAQQLATGQAMISSRSSGAKAATIQNPTYYTDMYGNYIPNDAQTRADYGRQVASMEQASQEERARVSAPVAQLMADTIATRARIRAQMVERYKVEF
jgi:hypothetical protein